MAFCLWQGGDLILFSKERNHRLYLNTWNIEKQKELLLLEHKELTKYDHQSTGKLWGEGTASVLVFHVLNSNLQNVNTTLWWLIAHAWVSAHPTKSHAMLIVFTSPVGYYYFRYCFSLLILILADGLCGLFMLRCLVFVLIDMYVAIPVIPISTVYSATLVTSISQEHSVLFHLLHCEKSNVHLKLAKKTHCVVTLYNNKFGHLIQNNKDNKFG